MPSRSRTSVPLADPASTPNLKSGAAKANALQEAQAMGRRHSASWSELDPTMRPRDAWRAIGYADAVLSFEHSPLLVELMRAWEQGFDGVSKPIAADVSAPTAEQPDAVTPNPYFANPDRAPYELGQLLQQLPADFGVSPVVELKHVQMASAAEVHAKAAGMTILSGIEAIGQLVEMAGANEEEKVPAYTLFCLGGLLRHLAVEGQYMESVSGSLAYANALYAKRGKVKSTHESGGQKGGAA
ncbi:hypothetical protein ACFFKC_16385 [Pseudoduganella danionis]|uniref:Uncharacterized protein n=1 Tax=Pseudoduganella danionis TaxID=1890295 RepID=A0ABW9SPE2_9BURK|nr:hypothetical protein [Pseudoduganella danionis]MTW33469.1 hypothetical protein [Pseudoduganella danionis]